MESMILFVYLCIVFILVNKAILTKNRDLHFIWFQRCLNYCYRCVEDSTLIPLKNACPCLFPCPTLCHSPCPSPCSCQFHCLCPCQSLSISVRFCACACVLCPGPCPCPLHIHIHIHVQSLTMSMFVFESLKQRKIMTWGCSILLKFWFGIDIDTTEFILEFWQYEMATISANLPPIVKLF